MEYQETLSSKADHTLKQFGDPSYFLLYSKQESLHQLHDQSVQLFDLK